MSESYVETDIETNVNSKRSELRYPQSPHSEGDDIEDSYNFVYFVFLFMGITSLMPWNLYLNISFDYFQNFKLVDKTGEATWYSNNFQNAMTISAQIPNLVCNILNVFHSKQHDLSNRMLICLGIVQLMILVTISFIFVDVSSWIPIFFVITLISIIFLDGSNGIFQNSAFGLASPFPSKYTNAVIVGQNLCGTIVSVFSIFTRIVAPEVQTRASIYFLVSSLFILFCAISIKTVKYSQFFQTFGILNQSEIITSNENEIIDSHFKTALKKGKWQYINIYILFFVTLSLFPNVIMFIEDAPKGSKYTFFLPEEYFMDVSTFLTFNVFALLGSITANYIDVLEPNTIWVPVFLRIFYLLYFPFCNYLPNKRDYPVLFSSTWAFLINHMIFAYSSGYLSSLIMMYAPSTCTEPRQQRIAGMISSFSLIFGIVSGLLFSWAIKLIIMD